MLAATATTLSIAALAIAGASFAWTIGWSIYTHRRATRPALKVSTSFALPMYGTQAGVESVSVEVANIGTVPTTLASVYFAIRGSDKTLAPTEWLVQDPRPLPLVLGPGERWLAMIAVEGIVWTLRHQHGEGLQPIRAVARDATRSYTANGWLTL